MSFEHDGITCRVIGDVIGEQRITFESCILKLLELPGLKFVKIEDGYKFISWPVYVISSDETWLCHVCRLVPIVDDEDADVVWL